MRSGKIGIINIKKHTRNRIPEFPNRIDLFDMENILSLIFLNNMTRQLISDFSRIISPTFFRALISSFGNEPSGNGPTFNNKLYP